MAYPAFKQPSAHLLGPRRARHGGTRVAFHASGRTGAPRRGGPATFRVPPRARTPLEVQGRLRRPLPPAPIPQGRKGVAFRRRARAGAAGVVPSRYRGEWSRAVDPRRGPGAGGLGGLSGRVAGAKGHGRQRKAPRPWGSAAVLGLDPASGPTPSPVSPARRPAPSSSRGGEASPSTVTKREPRPHADAQEGVPGPWARGERSPGKPPSPAGRRERSGRVRRRPRPPATPGPVLLPRAPGRRAVTNYKIRQLYKRMTTPKAVEEGPGGRAGLEPDSTVLGRGPLGVNQVFRILVVSSPRTEQSRPLGSTRPVHSISVKRSLVLF